MKPIVRVFMNYNTGMRANGRPPLPASWTATVDSTTLPDEFRHNEELVKIEASGFARSQALLGVEKQLKMWSIPYVLDVQG